MISIDKYNELKEKYDQLEERLDIMSEFKEKYLSLDVKYSSELREHKNSEIELERASLAKAKLTSNIILVYIYINILNIYY